MKNKIKNLISIVVIMLSISPSMIYANDDTFYDYSKLEASSIQNLTLDNAEIMLMMNTRGELYSSHTINNLNNEEVFIITIKEDEYLKTYLVEQDESIELINEIHV